MLWIVLACSEEIKENSEPSAESESPQQDTAESPVDTSEQPQDTAPPCEEQLWYLDSDGDGYGDPFVSTVSCEAPQGYTDNHADCNDANENEHPQQQWYLDSDGDGYGDPEQTLNICSQPTGYVLDSSDCDDLDGTRYPDALWYQDLDGDGYGDPLLSVAACDDVVGAVALNTDCDDSNWLIHPQSNEICDDIDNDCDGLVDDQDGSLDLFTQVLVYTDDDLDGYGETLIGYACPSSQLGATQLGDCDDTNPFVYPNQLDFADELDQNCDEDAFYYNIELSGQGWRGDIGGANFGRSAYSKDIDGDGLYELLIAAPTYEEDVGGIRFIPGAAGYGALDPFPVQGVVLNGVNDNDRAGWDLAFVGDMDGDGVEDILTGAYQFSENNGAVYLISTSASSGSLADHYLYEHPNIDSQFGYALVPLGDLNADGFDDALVSAPSEDTEGNNRGGVFLLYGGDLSAPLQSVPVLYGESNGDRLGYSMKNVGDVNGDGEAEILIGAPYADDYESNGGVVYLLSLSDLQTEGLILTDQMRYGGLNNSEKAGFSVGAPGDTNGDGWNDLLIGALDYDENEVVDVGAAYLVLGDSAGWTQNRSLDQAELIMIGHLENDSAGQFLGGLGDINGDGNQDFGVSAHGHDLIANNSGALYGILGGTLSGTIYLEESASFVVLGAGSSDTIGKGIAPAGDTNGDGLDDFWVTGTGAGSTGTVYLLNGTLNPP